MKCFRIVENIEMRTYAKMQIMAGTEIKIGNRLPSATFDTNTLCLDISVLHTPQCSRQFVSI